MPHLRTIDYNLLAVLYRDEGLTSDECAERLGCTRSGALRALRKMGVPIRDKGSGIRGKGHARFLMNNGYWAVYDPRRAGRETSTILEHRLIMERILGRPLRTDEHVHHRNGIKTDNWPENLELVTPQTHGQYHVGDGGWLRHGVCIDCGTTERPYSARGRCERCYNRWNLAKRTAAK